MFWCVSGREGERRGQRKLGGGVRRAEVRKSRKEVTMLAVATSASDGTHHGRDFQSYLLTHDR